VKLIEISKDLGLPLAVATGRTAFTGQSDSGKTYAAMKLAELLLAHGVQVVGVDPVGCWYGLKFGKDGKTPGFPIATFGGIHQDLPLPPDSGKVVASVLASSRMSAVLDLSEFTVAEHAKFVAHFAEHFFHEKKRNKSPVCIFWEEAQGAAPQELPPDPNAALMLNRVVRLVKVGRNYGVGNVLITQEPQAVSKRALSQVNCLFVGRMQGVAARKAIRDWVTDRAKSQADLDLMEQLVDLDQGEMFVAEPKWFGNIRRVRIASKRTFDSSKTPEVGESVPRPGKAAAVDLTELRASLAEMIEREEAQDPTVLARRLGEKDRRIADLEGALARKTTAPSPAPAREKRVEVPVLRPADVERLAKVVERMGDVADTLVKHAGQLRERAGDLVTEIKRASAPRPLVVAPPVPKAVVSAVAREFPPGSLPMRPSRGAPARRPAGGEEEVGLDKAQRAILSVLAQYAEGCERGKLALLAGYRWSGGFRNALSSLRSAGLMVGENSAIMRVTDAGRDALGPYDPLPTGSALVDYWMRHPSLGAMERAVLRVLVERPQGLDAEGLIKALNGAYTWSGGFRNALSNLRTAGLVLGRNSETMRASDALLEG
jgi:hypothetical protein